MNKLSDTLHAVTEMCPTVQKNSLNSDLYCTGLHFLSVSTKTVNQHSMLLLDFPIWAVIVICGEFMFMRLATNSTQKGVMGSQTYGCVADNRLAITPPEF